MCLKAFSSSCFMLAKSISADSRRAMTLMSTGCNQCLWCLKTSLVQRLIRLRITAQPTFLLTVIPRRGTFWIFICQMTRKPLVLILPGESKSLTKSARFRKRTDLGNVPTSLFWLMSRLFNGNSYRQALAAFGPSTLDNKPAVFGSHSYQKSMGTFARGIARLKGSFHMDTPRFIFSGTKSLTMIDSYCQEYIYFWAWIMYVICLEK